MPFSDSVSPEVKKRAFELYLRGATPVKIASMLAQEYENTEDILPTSELVSRWIDRENWYLQKQDITSRALLVVAQKEKKAVVDVSQEQLDAYRRLWKKGIDSVDGDNPLDFTRAIDAAKAVDIGIQGERKVMAGIINLQFVQDVMQILLDEIQDETLLQRVGTRLRLLAAKNSQENA